jgi:hypothetical protein
MVMRTSLLSVDVQRPNSGCEQAAFSSPTSSRDPHLKCGAELPDAVLFAGTL